MQPAANETFTLDYNSDQRLLVARWLQPAALTEIKNSYEAILSAAVASGNCRHWLLDVRRRPVGDALGLEWFKREFSPRLQPTLGAPVFVAYFAMINHDAAWAHAGMQASIREGEQGGGHFRYFNREDEARAWLAQQP